MIIPPDRTLSYYITIHICKRFYRYFLVCKPSPESDSVFVFVRHTGVLTVVIGLGKVESGGDDEQMWLFVSVSSSEFIKSFQARQ